MDVISSAPQFHQSCLPVTLASTVYISSSLSVRSDVMTIIRSCCVAVASDL